MKVRTVNLTLDECSELRLLISKKAETIKSKLEFSTYDTTRDDPFDRSLISYWEGRLSTLSSIFGKLCSTDFAEV